jgi:hypothetical protein
VTISSAVAAAELAARSASIKAPTNSLARAMSLSSNTIHSPVMRRWNDERGS